MYIAIVNQSTRVDDANLKYAVGAVAYQMRRHVAPLWNRPAPPVVFTDLAHVPAHSYVIGIFDNSDQAGALGWHTEDAQGNVYGRVFAAPSLDHGAQILVGPYSVASVLSHEVIEAFCDPSVSLWSQAGDGTMYAYEACDPVESDEYNVTYLGQTVSVSNFVLPAWFDPQAPGPYDFLKKLNAPFTMTPNGYYVYLPTSGQPQQKFGELYPEWKTETKSSLLARTSRRVPPPASEPLTQ